MARPHAATASGGLAGFSEILQVVRLAMLPAAIQDMYAFPPKAGEYTAIEGKGSSTGTCLDVAGGKDGKGL